MFPNQVIRTDDLAKAMVDVVVRSTRERETVGFRKPRNSCNVRTE
jgi:hypothetical protein